MSHMKVCVRFRPLSSRERSDHGDSVCVQCVDAETFNLKDEKEEIFTFSFDKVFYENSEQANVFEFLALPIVRDAVNGINGTIITYGQTGAGKTYSMEGPGILERDEQKKGLLPRVVDAIFECIKCSKETTKYSVKLSMVEIYMERVRDLLDLTKDNIQIKENKAQGIILHGITDISIAEPTEALQSLASGIANRAVEETQMNIASSRSHCVYIFTVQQGLLQNNRAKTGKLLLVDLAGSEKAEKTGAEGSVLEQAKTINKSLSALGNVINSLTCGSPGKSKHIPYRDSKVTRILQDALGGKSQTALLCCCSPSPSNASETLSTLRFGARASHVKVSMPVKSIKDEAAKKWGGVPSPTKDESAERILNKMRKRYDVETVDLLEELFIEEKVFSNLNLEEEVKAAYEDCVLKKILSLQQAEGVLVLEVEELKMENKTLKERIAARSRYQSLFNKAGETSGHLPAIPLIKCNEYKSALSPTKDDSCDKIILNELEKRIDVEDVMFLEELFVQEGILFDPHSEEYKSGSLQLLSAYGDDVTLQTISLLQQAVEELELEAEELWIENKALRNRIVAAKRSDAHCDEAREDSIFVHYFLVNTVFMVLVLGLFSFCISRAFYEDI